MGGQFQVQRLSPVTCLSERGRCCGGDSGGDEDAKGRGHHSARRGKSFGDAHKRIASCSTALEGGGKSQEVKTDGRMDGVVTWTQEVMSAQYLHSSLTTFSSFPPTSRLFFFFCFLFVVSLPISRFGRVPTVCCAKL